MLLDVGVAFSLEATGCVRASFDFLLNGQDRLDLLRRLGYRTVGCEMIMSMGKYNDNFTCFR